MARPKKVGLEYFPLDCQMDDKILMLEAEHGIEGFGVYIRLLQTIYQMEDGKLDMSVVFRWKTLGKTMGILPDNLRKMVDTMLEIELFDQKVFSEEQKLTSNGIQKRINRVDSMRQKDRLRKDDGFSAGKQGLSARKSAQKESNTNVLPKGKGKGNKDSLSEKNSDDGLSSDSAKEYTLTHQLKLAVEELVPGYYWNGKDGKPAVELIDKLKHSYRVKRKRDPTDAEVIDSFKLLVAESAKLRDYYHFSDIAKLNEMYNKLLSEIKNPGAQPIPEPVTAKRPEAATAVR